MKISSIITGVSSLAFPVTATTNITGNTVVTIPTLQPPFAKSVSPNLVGFSLEFQFWPTYAGNATGKPNQYVNQLLENLRERTGKPPAVRVGGTSENTAYVDTSLELWNTSQLAEVYGPFTHRSNTSIGRDWYVIAGNLPAGTEFTFGLNLYDESEVVAQTKMIAEAFEGSRASLTKEVTLKFIQIGNEPNFYFPSADSYVSHWTALAKAALKHIKLGGKGEPSLWIGSEVVGFSTSWSLVGTLPAGILDDSGIDKAGQILEEHLYSGALGLGAIPGGPPPGTLMEKSSIPANLSSLYDGPLTTESYGKTYYLGETGSYANEGIFGLSNTGESAVWTVDYLLKLASMGVSRVYLHSTPNRMFACFQPGWGFPNGTGIERPHIMPMYNGILVVDEMIGTHGDAEVAEIQNNNAAIASYAVWESGKLARVALINSNVYTETDAARSAVNVTLSGGFPGKDATVKRLSIPTTTATEGITWAGQSFETDNGKPSGDVVETPLYASSVIVSASEVVMISFSG